MDQEHARPSAGAADSAADNARGTTDAAPAGPARGSEVELLLARGDGRTRSFRLTGGVTTIGRRQDCTLRIPIGDVSRRHCQLICDGRDVSVADLGSSNGTFVNGRRVQEAPLLPGDRMTIGSLTFLVRIAGEPANLDVVRVHDPAEALAELAEGSAGSTDATLHLNPTAQSDAADKANWQLDPSGAAEDVDELMND